LHRRSLATWWHTNAGKSPLLRLGGDALIAASTSSVAKIFGFLREILVASLFGLSGALDIYVIAVVLVGFPVSIVLNAVQTTLISAMAAKPHVPADSARTLSTTMLLTTAFLAVLLPIWLQVLPTVTPWLASGFSFEKRHELETALYWLVPYYFLNGLNLLGYGALQARARYFINGSLPAVTPIVTIAILFALGDASDWRILAMALVVGTALEYLGLLVALHDHSQLARPRWADIRRENDVIRGALLLLPGTLMLAVGPVVEQAIAASMGEGTNAALAYGFKLPAALQGILLTAVGVTALPYFASQLGQNRAAYCLRSLYKLSCWLLITGVLFVVPLAAFSSEIVALLYQRGAFDLEATQRVAPIQLAYFVQLPFAIVAMVGMKALAALGQPALLSVYAILGVVVQCVLAYGLGTVFGASGIAWAAAAVSALWALAYFVAARSALLRLLA
jgi:putative peptidoglycan lipid II flippase